NVTNISTKTKWCHSNRFNNPSFLRLRLSNKQNGFYADYYFFLRRSIYTYSKYIKQIKVYFNERLYNLCIGLPFRHVSNTGYLNYQLFICNNYATLVPKNIPHQKSPYIRRNIGTN
ncbi:MAG: hypothetical protein ACKPKO_48945, partial [Candidatus Fonsibacter sp.]